MNRSLRISLLRIVSQRRPIPQRLRPLRMFGDKWAAARLVHRIGKQPDGNFQYVGHVQYTHLFRNPKPYQV